MLRRVPLAGRDGRFYIPAGEVQKTLAAAKHRLRAVLMDYHASVGGGLGYVSAHVYVGLAAGPLEAVQHGVDAPAAIQVPLHRRRERDGDGAVQRIERVRRFAILLHRRLRLVVDEVNYGAAG